MKIAVEGAPVPGSMTCPATTSWRREYNYDHFGNRWVTSNLTMHMAVPTSQSAFNAANNRLTAGGYDAAGNMTSHPYITPGGSMAYNANNLMTSFTATGVSVQTTYDAAGRLAAEYRNGTGPSSSAAISSRWGRRYPPTRATADGMRCSMAASLLITLRWGCGGSLRGSSGMRRRDGPFSQFERSRPH